MSYQQSRLHLQIAKVQALGGKKIAEQVHELLGSYKDPEMDPDLFEEAAATLQAAAEMLATAAETTRKHQAIIKAEEEAEAAADAAEAANG